MLRLILGRSKSGKTEYVRNYLASLALSGEDKLLMIVPDQQSFETEKAFLDVLGPKDALKVKVLGFSRLCDYVFETIGCVRKVMADESVRSLVMSMALEDTSDLLRLYGDKSLSRNLLSMMLSLHSEFAKGKVTSELLRSCNADSNIILRDKLHDTALVLSAFEALLSSSFEDVDGELAIACELLSYNNLFEDYYVCVDSYLSFTELEIDVLRVLMSQCKEILVTLSCNNTEPADDFFDISKSTARRLTAFAKEDGVTVGQPVVCNYKEFFSCQELLHIEKNIFDYNCKERLSVSVPAPVSIYNADTIYEECDYVARKIYELLMTKDYSHNDIAVVCRDISPYVSILDTTLDKYGISYFMDTPGFIHSKSLVKLITACFDCVTTAFNKDAVLALLKSGLVNTDVTTVSQFENYVFTWGISGTGFYKEWTANPRGFADGFTSDDLLELTRIEKLRRLVIEPLLSFRENIKDATAETICKELYSLLLKLGTDRRLLTLCDEYEKNFTPQLSEELVRLWQMFTDTLDRTIAVIGNRKVTPRRFCELLNIQFSAQDMSFIPRAADQITIGDIERLRLSGKKIVFVIGAVEGQFPRAGGDSGIFTTAERMVLCEAGILSDKSPDNEYLREQYLCYYALTSASDMLYVSYYSATLKGSAVAPSQLVTSLMSLFDNLSIINSSDVPIIDRLWSPKPSFDIYASRFGSKDEVTKALNEYYTNSNIYNAPVKSLQKAVTRREFRISTPEIAQKLFGSDMYLSASQVEKYHQCRFMYFCTYGLRLKERRAATIDDMEYGSFVHYILEHFVKSATKSDMCAMTDDEIKAKVEKLSEEYANLHFGGLEDKSQRFIYLFNRVSHYVQKLIRHLIEELLQSSFNPEAYELDIGKDIPAYTLTLPTGQTVTIRGKVDRADIMRKDGKTYLRIVDYKTGNKVFNLSDIMYGLNLQMLIYLSALSKNSSEKFGEVIPAGVLYMPAMVPVVRAAFSDTEDRILKERDKELRMNGLILRDTDVLQGMEREMSGIYIPAYINKKGELKGTDNLATLEELGAVFAHIDNLVSQMATELTSGQIAAVPLKGGEDSCKYCPYSSVCRHKETDPERSIYRLERTEILDRLGLKREEDSV